jgi:hypothetical protein
MSSSTIKEVEVMMFDENALLLWRLLWRSFIDHRRLCIALETAKADENLPFEVFARMLVALCK